MINNKMSKPDLASLFNLQFYRKQRKWRFTREVMSERAAAEPECSQSERAPLDQTYNVETPSELLAPAVLDEAFIDSANGGDGSSSSETDLRTEDSGPTKGALNWPEPSVPLREPHGPLGEPPDEPGYRTHCNKTFTDLDPELGSGASLLHRYRDDVTDYPHCEIGCSPRQSKLHGYRDLETSSTHHDALCARALHDYFQATGPRSGQVLDQQALQDFDSDLWKDRDLIEQVDDCAKGWPQHSAVWTNTGQCPTSDQWLRMYAEATCSLPEMVDFSEEELLVTRAQSWLQLQRSQSQARSQQRDRSPPLCKDLDCLDGYTYPDDNFLLEKMTARPRDRILACCPSQGATPHPPRSGYPPGDCYDQPGGCYDLPGGCYDLPGGCFDLPGGYYDLSSGCGSQSEQSIDSERFMLGAHTAPHSSEIELFSGSGASPLCALVTRHARALSDLLAQAQDWPAHGQSLRPSSSHSAHNLTSFEEFPTRDVGPCPPGAPMTPPVPPETPPGQGRGRGRRGECVIALSAGRPYRL